MRSDISNVALFSLSKKIILVLALLFSKAYTQEDPVTNERQDEIAQNESLIDDADTIDASDEHEEPSAPAHPYQNKIIKEIIIQGNKQVPNQAIIHRLPYRVGEPFDELKTRDLIKRLYNDLNRFRSIEVYVEPLDNDQINLIIEIEEKKILKEYQFVGNTQVSEKEILEKIPLNTLPALDPEELQGMARKIKKIYADKGYHIVDIDPQLVLDDNNKAAAVFTIKEYPKSLVKRIQFCGNENLSGKHLRSIMFSREDWILSFLDQSGIYQPERIEADRHIIEQEYQNKGYINAKVTDVKVDFDACNNIHLTYDIIEGPRYCIGSVSIADTDGLTSEQILACLPLQVGQVYSREMVMDSIKALEHLWGSRGYLFANVEPSIIPDEESLTVAISFNQELGDRVYLNRLNIIGNQKTRDKIIRRQLLIEEGDLITEPALEGSKTRVESLGYFQIRDGVNWKTHRIDKNLADLDLILKEEKTGHANVQLGFGGTASINSPADGLSAEFNINDTNVLGYGLAASMTGRFSKSEKTFIANLTQPWLFDKPIMASLDLYHKRLGYEEFRLTNAINEQRTGTAFTTGFVTTLPSLYLNDVFFRCNIGFDSIKYDGELLRMAQIEENPIDPSRTNNARVQYNILLRKTFSPGLTSFFTFTLGQDKRNHPMHPNRGHQWTVRSVTGLPISSDIAYEKLDLDFHWFTPLIGVYDLIFHWHNYIGTSFPIQHRTIPYGELFHIGGPASVRGYLFGDLSPRFIINGVSDSIGSSNAFFVNAELIFPIRPDMTMKGVFFYDGGSGWHNPYVNAANQQFIINQGFDYRHAVGAGIRMLNPMPIKIDIGFKLDPRENERPYEVHFGMNYDW